MSSTYSPRSDNNELSSDHDEVTFYHRAPAVPGFNGEFHEPTTEWKIRGNGYRVYSPVLMRFHSPDSLSPFGEGRGEWVYVLCGGPGESGGSEWAYIGLGSFEAFTRGSFE